LKAHIKRRDQVSLTELTDYKTYKSRINCNQSICINKIYKLIKTYRNAVISLYVLAENVIRAYRNVIKFVCNQSIIDSKG
jgi:intergrase/recombinase